MPAPSHAIKAALKAAVRRAPGGPRGRDVSNLSVPQLKEIATRLGLDVAQIEHDALGARGQPAPRATPATPAGKPRYYSCGICGAYHSVKWNGDCRENTARFDPDDLDAEHGPEGWEEMDMPTTIDAEEQAIMPLDLNDDTAEADAEEHAIEQEVSSIARLVGIGGFVALDARLRELVREARKPAVTIVERVEVPIERTVGDGAVPIVVARHTNTQKTWRELFGLKGPLSSRTIHLWDGAHPDTPAVNRRYIFPDVATTIALTQIARKRNVYLFGPPGTGKTEWATQLAARTGRPLAVISCDNATDAPTLIGMTVPGPNGGTVWQDGQLTRAIKTPGCVILIDEPSVARPGALMVMQNMLANRVLWHAETGLRVPVAQGVIFIAADNTNGTGGGGKYGYTDTNQLNAAFMDRFGVRIDFDFLPRNEEIRALVGYTGCTKELAELLISAAAVTRAAAANAQLTTGISFRRLLSWAEQLTDGISPADAFRVTVLNGAKLNDVETLRQQCLLAYDTTAVQRALDPLGHVTTGDQPDPTMTNPTLAGRNAAGDFDPAN